MDIETSPIAMDASINDNVPKDETLKISTEKEISVAATVGITDDKVIEMPASSSSSASAGVNVIDEDTLGQKRPASEISNGAVTTPVASIPVEVASPVSVPRPRLNVNKVAKIEGVHSTRSSGKERCK